MASSISGLIVSMCMIRQHGQSRLNVMLQLSDGWLVSWVSSVDHPDFDVAACRHGIYIVELYSGCWVRDSANDSDPEGNNVPRPSSGRREDGST
jgi:hypothetical protein